MHRFGRKPGACVNMCVCLCLYIYMYPGDAVDFNNGREPC